MSSTSIAAHIQDRPLFHIHADQTVRDAALEMVDHHIGALPVMEGDTLVGVLSEKDIVARAVCADMDVDTTSVRDIMTPAPESIDADKSMADAYRAMKSGGFRHLLVTQDGQLIGVLSIRDISSVTRRLVDQFVEMSNAAPGEMAKL